MSPPFSCRLELHTKEPQVIMNALRADDQDNTEVIEYSVLGDRLVVSIRSDCLRPFTKTVAFFLERFKLSSDAVALCESECGNAGAARKPRSSETQQCAAE